MQYPKEATHDDLNSMVREADVTTGAGYYKVVREGISGETFRNIVESLNERDVFARVLNTDKSNLSKTYKKAKLPTNAADNVIDSLRIYIQATRIYGSLDVARQWLHSAIPALGGETPAYLLDTQAGRELVRQTLNKIEYGEFV